jgi:hypothetical protein
MTQQVLVIGQRVGQGVALPRGENHVNRVEIRSESSNRLYIVAQRVSQRADLDGQWECSCPGWKTRRTCKHLTAMLPPLRASLGGHQAAPISKAIAGQNQVAIPTRQREKRDPMQGYRTYNTANGFGNSADWIRIAEDLIAEKTGDRTRFRAKGGQRRGMDKDLELLGLDALPETVAAFKSHVRRNVLMRVHPDQGGTNEAFREAMAAFERVLGAYEP